MVAASPARRDVLYIYCTLYRELGLGLPWWQSVQPVEMFYIHIYIVLCTGGFALAWLAMVAASIDVLYIYCTLYRGLDLGLPWWQSVWPVEMFYIYVVLSTGGLGLGLPWWQSVWPIEMFYIYVLYFIQRA